VVVPVTARRIHTTDAPRYENQAMIPQPIVTDEAPRCWRCRRKLADLVSRPWQLVCTKCKATNASAPATR
jgi:hypothetical protein